MCRHRARVIDIERWPYPRIRLAGTIRSAYLHRGEARVLAQLRQAMAADQMVDMEVVRGAIVRVYGPAIGELEEARPKARNRILQPRLHQPKPGRLEKVGGFGYLWQCKDCGGKFYTVQQPVYCIFCG